MSSGASPTADQASCPQSPPKTLTQQDPPTRGTSPNPVTAQCAKADEEPTQTPWYLGPFVSDGTMVELPAPTPALAADGGREPTPPTAVPDTPEKSVYQPADTTDLVPPSTQTVANDTKTPPLTIAPTEEDSDTSPPATQASGPAEEGASPAGGGAGTPEEDVCITTGRGEGTESLTPLVERGCIA